ncbi:mitotic spindle assembly checkpoint protein MAD2B isoform 2-T5 [Hipposideros larvatus]
MMSCHPELNQYIQDTLHCVKPLLEKNDVEKVVVVILDKEHRPVEKFVFEITQPPLLSISSDSLLSHVEQLLRAFILKISVCDAVLDHNPPGCTFTVLVHTREAATRNMEKIQVIKDFPWILADEQDVHMHDPRLIPLKTMTSDILKVSIWEPGKLYSGFAEALRTRLGETTKECLACSSLLPPLSFPLTPGCGQVTPPCQDPYCPPDMAVCSCPLDAAVRGRTRS